jgi:hypothetical protein
VEVLGKVVSDDQNEEEDDDGQDLNLDAPITKAESGAVLKDIYMPMQYLLPLATRLQRPSWRD